MREGSACRAGSIPCSREVTGHLRDSMQCESGGTPPHLALSASQISRLTRCGGWRLWWLWPRAQHRGSAVAPMVTPVLHRIRLLPVSPHTSSRVIRLTGTSITHRVAGSQVCQPTLEVVVIQSAVVEVVARLSRQPSAVDRRILRHGLPADLRPGVTDLGFPETWRFDAFCNGHTQNATCAG